MGIDDVDAKLSLDVSVNGEVAPSKLPVDLGNASANSTAADAWVRNARLFMINPPP